MHPEKFFMDLFIVIVNYNLKEDTIDCINSLLDAKALLPNIIVVDNQSTDGSVEALREAFDERLNIIQAEDNRGYPHALNIGIPEALKRNAEWVLLMNNDVLVAEDFLLALQEAVLKHQDVLLFSPMILYHQQPSTIWYLGSKAIPGTLIGIRSFRGKKDNQNFPDIIPIDFVHGCAFLAHKVVFNKIGLFDDTHLIYGDDADFSWRAKLAGFKLGAIPKAKMWHKIATTMGHQKSRTRYLRIRNIIFFYQRYSNPLQKIIMFLFTTIRSIILIILDLFSGKHHLIAPTFYGWIDGWRLISKNRYETE
jgi:GT2 family glycosyltransferase